MIAEQKKKKVMVILLICLGVLLCAALGAFVIWHHARPKAAPAEQTTTQAATAATTEAATTAPADVSPPVIAGAGDQTFTVGEAASYRTGVTATDPEEGEVTLQIDASAVNAEQAGTYPLVYWAEDAAGNRTELTVQVTFLPEETRADKENEPQTDTAPKDYRHYAQKVNSKILKKGMTDKEKIKAIWKWCHKQISFTGHSKKTDWKVAARTGFTKLKGDCYIYFATAKALLQEAGFSTKDVVKIKMAGRSDHYWLLVKLNGSWYHFDACPRKGAGGKTFCLYTDQQMLEFSETHNDCFDFDLRKYPRTPGKIADQYLIKFYPELFEEQPTVPEPETTPPETAPPEIPEETTEETTAETT